MACKSFPGCAKETASVKTMMGIEIFVFDGDSGLLEVVGKIVEFDGSTVLVGINLVEEVAVAIEDFGGDGIGARLA